MTIWIAVNKDSVVRQVNRSYFHDYFQNFNYLRKSIIPRLGIRTLSSMWTRPLVPKMKSLLRMRASSMETPLSSQCNWRRLPPNVLMWCSSMMAEAHNGCTKTWFCSNAVHHPSNNSIVNQFHNYPRDLLPPGPFLDCFELDWLDDK